MVPGKAHRSTSSRKTGTHVWGTTPAISCLKVDGHIAEIRHDTTANPPIFHCVVQPENSTEIIFFAQSYTREEAEGMALQFIRELTGEIRRA